MKFRLPLRRASAPFTYPGQELKPLPRQATTRPDVLPQGEVRRSVETGRTRLLVTAGLFAMAFLAVSGRLVDVMVLKAGPTHAAQSRSAASETYVTSRAEITDRNGFVLATNLPTVDLYADAARVVEATTPEQAADDLLAVLPHLKRADLIERLKSGKRFVYLERNLTPRQKAMVNTRGVPGVYFMESERRVYPQGPLVSHVLGATDPDNNGIAGVEAAFDTRLKTDPTPLRLSLDLRVQGAVHTALSNSMAHFKAKGAAAVVLDAKTGETIAMVSLPDYQPERFGAADKDARFNRATLGVFEMGSTFKVFTTAMALDSGLVRLGDTYDTTKPLRVARFTINDSHPENYWMNVPEILIHSSNIGSARMALTLGTDQQRAYLQKLGLLEAPTLELPEVGAPLYPAQWREINTMTISYGHGIAVTPANVAAALAATVNGGILHKATLLARDISEPIEGTRVLKEETSLLMRKLMRLVVTEGTASKANVPGYIVGGKTGTAEKVATAGGYDRRRLRTTFTAAFPMDDPRYVVITVLDEPQPLKSTFGFANAGWNAAPASGDIIRAIAPLVGVFPRPHAEAAFVPAMEDKGRVTAQSAAVLAALPGGAHAAQ